MILYFHCTLNYQMFTMCHDIFISVLYTIINLVVVCSILNFAFIYMFIFLYSIVKIFGYFLSSTTCTLTLYYDLYGIIVYCQILNCDYLFYNFSINSKLPRQLFFFIQVTLSAGIFILKFFTIELDMWR